MPANTSRHSAQVELYLVLNGRQLELAQVGPDHCVVRHPQDIPPEIGEIVMLVDGEETRLSVFLPNGISAAKRRVPYTQLSTTQSSAKQEFAAH